MNVLLMMLDCCCLEIHGTEETKLTELSGEEQ